jgi:hypothetical protein
MLVSFAALVHPAPPGALIPLQGPLFPLVTSLRDTINRTGQALERAQATTLGQLILQHLDAAKAQG